MYAKSLFAFAFAFFPLNTASAGDVVYQARTTFEAGQAAPSLAIPIAISSPKHGTLEGMEIRMTVSVFGASGVENLTKNSSLGVLFTDYGADMTAFDGQVQLAAGGQFAQLRKFGSYDGATDFAGSSGTVIAVRETSASKSLHVSGKHLSSLLKDIKAHSWSLDLSGGANASLKGLPYSAQKSRLYVGVQVEVTYRFNDSGNTPPSVPPAQPQGPQPLYANGLFGNVQSTGRAANALQGQVIVH